MTIREIKREIEALGFGDLCELTDSLIPTLNRCLSIIEAAHPRIVVTELPFFPARSILLPRKINSGEESVIEMTEGSEISFSLQGTGEYKVVMGATESAYSFATLNRRVSISFAENGRVIFGGGDYTVFDISLTKGFPPPLNSAVSTLGDGYLIDLAALYPDFLYLASTPTDKLGRQIPSLKQFDRGEIFIPKSFFGSLIISYRGKFSPLDELQGDDAEIDIAPELLPLLSLLASYYLWLDDDADKASEYRERYEELSAELRKKERVMGGGYLNLSRWA